MSLPNCKIPRLSLLLPLLAVLIAACLHLPWPGRVAPYPYQISYAGPVRATHPSPEKVTPGTGLPPASTLDRLAQIPASAVKMTASTDANPPQLLSPEYEQPVPVPGAVNTAGAEDSPFITPDGNTLYFFFTPDIRIPAEKQLLDGVTGIYVSQKAGGAWGPPERILLQGEMAEVNHSKSLPPHQPLDRRRRK